MNAELFCISRNLSNLFMIITHGKAGTDTDVPLTGKPLLPTPVSMFLIALV